ncbi:hypothetical protein GA0070607_3212 [Micromonospora coriariae]|uniref:Uncharacterized protein n=1 Tax=Micromonospora coriariae TaxID=285665 RepID=A0A1C4W6T5_9ACTN|nr:hypothetical protein [Micromonospora coriariae]SCE91932.1 hypothetical protein GA0070607_3212 [Micromonospora coriariae]
MPELENVDLAGEFNRYRNVLLAEIEVPGPAEVRRTVRRRRRRHRATAASVAIALLGGPAVGYAALDRPDQPPGPVDPTPGLTASPTPNGSPSPTAAPSVTTASPTRVIAPDGRISRAQLLAARVDLPAWRPGPAGCPVSGARLSGDPATAKEGTNALEAIDYADVDGDGATETVAMLQCSFGTRGPQQVVAFDRDEAGRIVTIGRVVATALEKPQWLTALDGRSDGIVRVEVADLPPGGGWPGEWSQRQWRGYRWTGERFSQVEGPTSFGPNPYSTNLAVTAKDLVLADDPADGSRVGAVQVRVRAVGDRHVDEVSLELELPASLTPDGPAWSGCGPDVGKYRSPLRCRLGPIEANGELTVDLGVRLPPGAELTPGTATVRGMASGPGGHYLIDPDLGNNEDTIAYR